MNSKKKKNNKEIEKLNKYDPKGHNPNQKFEAKKFLDIKTIGQKKYVLVQWNTFCKTAATWETCEKFKYEDFKELYDKLRTKIKSYDRGFYFDRDLCVQDIQNFDSVELESHATIAQKIIEVKNQIENINKQLAYVKYQQQKELEMIQYQSPKKPSDYPILDYEITEGSFLKGDRIDKILRKRTINNNNLYYILWKRRINDILPLNNWLREEEVNHFEPKILEVYYQKFNQQ